MRSPIGALYLFGYARDGWKYANQRSMFWIQLSIQDAPTVPSG